MRYFRRDTKKKTIDYIPDFVTSSIAIGNSQDAQDIDMLLSNDITAVLNVAVDLDITYTLVNNKFPVEYHKVGLHDSAANKPETLLAAVSMLTQLLETHKKVLVHCHGGISRSVIVVAMYLVYTHRAKSLDKALSIIRYSRVNAKVNDGLKQTALIAMKVPVITYVGYKGKG